MNTIYDEQADILYIIIYQLNKSRHIIWFSVQLTNFVENIKRKKINIDYKAIKICEDNDDGNTELSVSTKLIRCKNKNEYINYPIHSFKIDNKIVIIYDLAIGSLYSLIKYRKINPIEYEKFVMDVISQMIESLNFLHKCKFIHTDIKPENFLICGRTFQQNEIIEFIENYKLATKFPSTIKKKDIQNIIKKTVNTFTKSVIEKFNLPNIKDVDIFDNSSSSSNDFSCNDYDNDNDNNNNNNNNNNNSNCCSDDSDASIVSDLISNYSETSYVSNDGDYLKYHDNFHTKYILNDLKEKMLNSNNNNNNNSDNSNNNNNDNTNDCINDDVLQNKSVDNEYEKHCENELKKEYDFIKKYIVNPKIKLTDFEYMINENTQIFRTMQNRCYRSPEIILGYKYTKKSDYYALACSIYEMVTGEPFVTLSLDDNYGIYDNDLLNLKLLIEKTNNFDKFIELIQKSSRKNYLITNTNNLKFVKKYDFGKYWKNDMIGINEKIIKFIEINLELNPNDRNLIF